MYRACALAVMLAFLALGLLACGGSNDGDADTPTAVDADTDSTVAATETGETPEATGAAAAPGATKPVETPDEGANELPPEERTTVFFVHTDW